MYEEENEEGLLGDEEMLFEFAQDSGWIARCSLGLIGSLQPVLFTLLLSAIFKRLATFLHCSGASEFSFLLGPSFDFQLFVLIMRFVLCNSITKCILSRGCRCVCVCVCVCVSHILSRTFNSKTTKAKRLKFWYSVPRQRMTRQI
ncbi:unnamed protein product [Gongylonema pulchrum]|uniref:Transmembrane protein n=1 Tax=Gongylonema pulchrum TaxID=637853 RepID=A0A183D8N8_9BILA|nr:unnamed protein product [Gongylonema pulchrum]